jgi:flagellar protein FliS
MQLKDLARRYHQTQVETADPLELVIMAYDGIISSLKRASGLDQEGDLESRSREIQRALDLINELWAALDMERGGEIAASLASIYRFVTSQILIAEAKRDMEMMLTVARLLEGVKEGWCGIKNYSTGRRGAELPWRHETQQGQRSALHL